MSAPSCIYVVLKKKKKKRGEKKNKTQKKLGFFSILIFKCSSSIDSDPLSGGQVLSENELDNLMTGVVYFCQSKFDSKKKLERWGWNLIIPLRDKHFQNHKIIRDQSAGSYAKHLFQQFRWLQFLKNSSTNNFPLKSNHLQTIVWFQLLLKLNKP